MKSLTLIIMLSTLLSCSIFKTNKDPSKWKLAGKGRYMDLGPNNFILHEGLNSKGVMLISPNKVSKNFEIEYDIKPNQKRGVIVFLHSIKDKESHDYPSIPEEYDGDWGLWKNKNTKIDSYAIAMHTKFHQPFSFIRKNPGFTLLNKNLDRFSTQKWHKVKIVKNGINLILYINNQKILQAMDKSPLEAGYMAFRLRGPGDGTFFAEVKNIRIKEM